MELLGWCASESARGSHSACVVPIPGCTLRHGPAVLVHMVKLQWRATVFCWSYRQSWTKSSTVIGSCWLTGWGARLGRWVRLGGLSTAERRRAREQWSEARALDSLLVVPLSPHQYHHSSPAWPGPSASAYIPERDYRPPSAHPPCLRLLLASTRSFMPHPSHPCQPLLFARASLC